MGTLLCVIGQGVGGEHLNKPHGVEPLKSLLKQRKPFNCYLHHGALQYLEVLPYLSMYIGGLEDTNLEQQQERAEFATWYRKDTQSFLGGSERGRNGRLEEKRKESPSPPAPLRTQTKSSGIKIFAGVHDKNLPLRRLVYKFFSKQCIHF